MTVRQLEQTFLLRFWWLFPCLGAVGSVAVGGPFWKWVSVESFEIPWAALWSGRSLLWALIFSAIPALWALGMRVKENHWWVGGLALALFLSIEIGSQARVLQVALWLGARARLEPDQHFMREVCYVRLEELDGRASATPGVMVVGSSQILNGVDTPKIRQELAPTPVIRRAMFGMGPLKALAMLPYMPFVPGDRCLLYLSEFDFTNQDAFPFSWIRPYASWKTLPLVFDCLSWRVRLQHWRQLADVSLAASLPSWQTRDFTQRIVLKFWGGRQSQALAEPDLRRELLIRDAQGELQDAEGEYRAFSRVADYLTERGVRMVIFEGEVNDAIYSPSRWAKKEQVCRFLTQRVEGGEHRYVSRAEQQLNFLPSDWSDMSHLNDQGREKLTAVMISILCEELAEEELIKDHLPLPD